MDRDQTAPTARSLACEYDARMYLDILGQMKKQLAQMDKWLEAAAAYADSKNFDGNVLLTMRLAPDQFAFARQVQIACDTAKFGASRITGKDAAVQADDEETLEALRARVASVIAYLDGFDAGDFEGAGDRTVTQPRWKGKVMSTHDYLLQHVMPNFYFHTTHVYAILRHSGMPIGKRDYLGPLDQYMP
jgi:hypothetical protein